MRGHRLGRLLRDRAIEDEVLAVPAAQQGADRQAGGLAEDVPAGDVDARLDVGMPLERGVHPAVQPPELGRVLADQVRAELGDPGPDAAAYAGR